MGLGGLWYFTYPNWSYLDGMISYTSFASLYTNFFNSSDTKNTTNQVIYQLDLLWSHCFDNATGLLFHGYDASKTAVWANPVTGASPIVWGRALGWYFMALVDWLGINKSQAQSSQWAHVHARFVALADAIVEAADPATGAWWQVLNFPGREGNYIESSGSSMFVYGLYKGVRLGYLSSQAEKHQKTANKAYEYLVDNFVVKNQNGTLSWNGTVSVCSLNSSATYEVFIPISFSYGVCFANKNN
jgi:rhamnogalacturonyl hydrolase YesR